MKGLLFDLDGTLTNPKEGITTSVQYALSFYGIEANLDDLVEFIGPPLHESFINYYGFDIETAKEAVEKYREYFSVKGIYENLIYPGIKELLNEASKHFKIGLATSKPTIFAKKILHLFDIEEYFDVVVGSELDGTRTNKAEVIAEAIKQLRPLESTFMIGDRKYDIEGAKKCGIKSIAVQYGYALENELEISNPDYIVSTVEDLGSLLQKLK